MAVLQDRTAVVTGGGAGIGRATCLALGRAGAHVAVWDVDAAAAEETATLLRAEGAQAMTVIASVADPDAVRGAFATLDAQLGRLDILINNAGISANRPTLEVTDEEWRRGMSINLDGVFYCAREAGRRMQAQNSGCIVNMASMYGVVAAPNRIAYTASKAAVVMMTKSLAVEWAGFGIRVNAVAPGYIRTALLEDLAAVGKVDLAALTRRTPQGRLGTAEEIADSVLYLCEPRSAFITGQVLGVDGGWTAYGYV
ncbi:MAG TPA: SDR family NAD(P)-dependent oxidoreductase [Roseomonas sp.]|nr:SDR family NAD(P)-dependent oxidoreductase [Roseomonas sp.]